MIQISLNEIQKFTSNQIINEKIANMYNLFTSKSIHIIWNTYSQNLISFKKSLLVCGCTRCDSCHEDSRHISTGHPDANSSVFLEGNISWFRRSVKVELSTKTTDGCYMFSQPVFYQSKKVRSFINFDGTVIRPEFWSHDVQYIQVHIDV